MRIVFLGSPEFAVPTLKVLLHNSPPFEVVAVVTQSDKPAGRDLKVKKSRIKSFSEDYLSGLGRMAKKFTLFSPEDPHNEEFLDEIQKLAPDIAVVVAYGKILKPAFLKLFKLGAVNVHASLLPKWRGAAPYQWTIWKQEKETGVTLQKIAPKLDAGDIIAQLSVPVGIDWDAPKLYTELSQLGAELVKRYLPDFCDGKIKATPQNESEATYARKLTVEDGKINWNAPAIQILAQLRALDPWPGVWTTREGKKLKILRAKAINYVGGEPSEVFAADKKAFYVQCAGGTALCIEVVQPESRARMPSASYLAGKPFVKGDKLGT